MNAILRMSRPRFWIYLLGPFALGLLAGVGPSGLHMLRGQWLELLLWGLFFSLPANALIYGVNDYFDRDTDAVNAKKQGYELAMNAGMRTRAFVWIALLVAPFLALAVRLPRLSVWGLVWFLVFGIFYSAPPVRAKAIPFIDSLFNVLYVMPGIVGFGLVNGGGVPVAVLVAALCWCMAMHAYSAIPDIAADTAAGLRTVATVLGARKTILWCAGLYILSAILMYSRLPFVIVLVLPYVVMMWKTLGALSLPAGETRLFTYYTWFPIVNTLVGFVLFELLLLRAW